MYIDTYIYYKETQRKAEELQKAGKPDEAMAKHIYSLCVYIYIYI